MNKFVMVRSLDAWFEKLGGSSIEGAPEYPFRLRVLVAGYRVTPRHSMFSSLLEMGSLMIPKILRHEPLELESGAELLFVLPERWMSVHEQKLFVRRLTTHPEVRNLEGVDIVTQGVLIIGGVKARSVSIFEIQDNDPEGGLLDTDV